MAWFNDCGHTLQKTWPLSLCATPKSPEVDEWRKWPKISDSERGQAYKRPPMMTAPSLDFGISNPVTAHSARQTPVPASDSRGTRSRAASRSSARTKSTSRSRSRNRLQRSRTPSKGSLHTKAIKGRPAIGTPQNFVHVGGHAPGIPTRPRATSTPWRPLELSIHIPGNELPSLPTFYSPQWRSSTIPLMPSIKTRPRSMSTPAVLAQHPRASTNSISRKPVAAASMPFSRESTTSMLRSARYSEAPSSYAESELDPDFEPAVISPYNTRTHSMAAQRSTRMLVKHLSNLPPPPPLTLVTVPSTGTRTPDSTSTEVPLALGPPVESPSPVSPKSSESSNAITVPARDERLDSAFVSPLPIDDKPEEQTFRFPASTFSTYETSTPPEAVSPPLQQLSSQRYVPSPTPSPNRPLPAAPTPVPAARIRSPTPSIASTASSSSVDSDASSIDPNAWHFISTPPRNDRRGSNGTMTTATTASPQPPAKVLLPVSTYSQRANSPPRPRAQQVQPRTPPQAQQQQQHQSQLRQPTPRAQPKGVATMLHAQAALQKHLHQSAPTSVATRAPAPAPTSIPAPTPATTSANSVRQQIHTQIQAASRGSSQPQPQSRLQPVPRAQPRPKSRIPTPLTGSVAVNHSGSGSGSGAIVIESTPVSKPSIDSSMISPRQSVLVKRQSVHPAISHVRNESANSSASAYTYSYTPSVASYKAPANAVAAASVATKNGAITAAPPATSSSRNAGPKATAEMLPIGLASTTEEDEAVVLQAEEQRRRVNEQEWRQVVWREEMEAEERTRRNTREEMREKEKGRGVGRREVGDGENGWGKGLGVEFGIAY